MADYTLLKNQMIRRNVDGSQFPESPTNRDRIEYLKWQTAGNTPDPIEPDPPPSQDELNIIAAKADADVIALAAMTPVQAAAWVTANVTDLASARSFLKRVAIILSVLAKRL